MERLSDSNNFIETIEFQTAEELFQFIAPWNHVELHDYVFRGHSVQNYQLIPSALRIEKNDSLWLKSGLDKPSGEHWKYETWQIQAEKALLLRFYRLADKQGLAVPNLHNNIDNYFLEKDSICFNEMFKHREWLPVEYYELAALAQHYGIPTRLLDWTYDVYVALYFAFKDSLTMKSDITIWCINRNALIEHKNCNKELKIEFITPHYANNQNISAQKGLFSLWPINTVEVQTKAMTSDTEMDVETNRNSLDEIIKSAIDLNDKINYFKKLNLSNREVKNGLVYLDLLGYNCSTIFPGYKGVADEILFAHEYKKKT